MGWIWSQRDNLASSGLSGGQTWKTHWASLARGTERHQRSVPALFGYGFASGCPRTWIDSRHLPRSCCFAAFDKTTSMSPLRANELVCSSELPSHQFDEKSSKVSDVCGGCGGCGRPGGNRYRAFRCSKLYRTRSVPNQVEYRRLTHLARSLHLRSPPHQFPSLPLGRYGQSPSQCRCLSGPSVRQEAIHFRP